MITNLPGLLFSVWPMSFCRGEVFVSIQRGSVQLLDILNHFADSLNRCMANIGAFFDLADLGRSLGYDLWSGEGGDRLKSATLWLINHGFDAEWPGNRGASTESLQWIPLLLRAAQRLPGRDVEKRLRQIGDEAVISDWSHLLYSSPDR